MDKKSNNKWIILGCIVIIVAILIAVGPFLLNRYIVSKWQNAGYHKVTNVMMNVKGVLCLSSDNTPYLIGENKLYYLLENLKLDDVASCVGKHCGVIGKIRKPQNGETIDGNPIRLFIDVQKFNIEGKNLENNDKQSVENEEVNTEESKTKDKSLRRAQLRVEVNTILNKAILFDVIKGKVSSITTKSVNGEDVTLIILTNEFNDKYALYKKGKDFSSLKDKNIICLGREILTPKEIPLIVDIVTFEIFEVYDEQYNKLM